MRRETQGQACLTSTPDDRQGQARVGIPEDKKLFVRKSEKLMQTPTQHEATEAT